MEQYKYYPQKLITYISRWWHIGNNSPERKCRCHICRYPTCYCYACKLNGESIPFSIQCSWKLGEYGKFFKFKDDLNYLRNKFKKLLKFIVYTVKINRNNDKYNRINCVKHRYRKYEDILKLSNLILYGYKGSSDYFYFKISYGRCCIHPSNFLLLRDDCIHLLRNETYYIKVNCGDSVNADEYYKHDFTGILTKFYRNEIYNFFYQEEYIYRMAGKKYNYRYKDKNFLKYLEDRTYSEGIRDYLKFIEM